MTGTASVTFSGSVEVVAKSGIPSTLETARSRWKVAVKRPISSRLKIPSLGKNAHEVHLSTGDRVEVTIDAKADAIRAV